jgi:Kef-type K+ transport system membrane component KefB
MLIIFKAFPVLCRILTELKLLSTPVGIITLASGVGDDVVGWICKFCA